MIESLRDEERHKMVRVLEGQGNIQGTHDLAEAKDFVEGKWKTRYATDTPEGRTNNTLQEKEKEGVTDIMARREENKKLSSSIHALDEAQVFVKGKWKTQYADDTLKGQTNNILRERKQRS